MWKNFPGERFLIVLTWFRRLFAPPPKLVTVLNRLDELEERVEYLASELKRLRGRVTGGERREKAEPTLEDAPGPTISPTPDPRLLEKRRALRGF